MIIGFLVQSFIPSPVESAGPLLRSAVLTLIAPKDGFETLVGDILAEEIVACVHGAVAKKEQRRKDENRCNHPRRHRASEETAAIRKAPLPTPGLRPSSWVFLVALPNVREEIRWARMANSQCKYSNHGEPGERERDLPALQRETQGTDQQTLG